MRIALHGRSFKESNLPFVQLIMDELERREAQLVVNRSFHAALERAHVRAPAHELFGTPDELRADMVLSVGGDGTLLETVTLVGDKQIPILGINLGRLGFLASTAAEQIVSAFDQVFAGYYDYDLRTLIKLESDRPLFNGTNFGMNEFTILKRDTSSMIVVHTYIDGEYLNSYWADGLIVATPSGSTGYSLSVGGPVVLPDSNNFIIAPVSPHNLNVRPLIVSDESVISFGIQGRSKNFLISLDSRSEVVDDTIQLAVRKERFKARLVKLNNYNFLHTLRSKLNWGLDARN